MYKKYDRLANELATDLQNKINEKGIYENAGQNEIRYFEDQLSKSDLTYSEKYQLKQMFINKIDSIANNF